MSTQSLPQHNSKDNPQNAWQRCPACFRWVQRSTMQPTPSADYRYYEFRTPPVNVCQRCAKVIPLALAVRPEYFLRGQERIKNLIGYRFGRVGVGESK